MPMHEFFTIQTATGWGRTLQAFADWCDPQPGWATLDAGCGPGLLPALLAQRGCRATGVDLDSGAVSPARLHPSLAVADVRRLPFAPGSFQLITASNLLFLLTSPLEALEEMVRLLAPDGQVAVLNPSEQMSVQAVQALVEARGLQGVARDSLLNWAERAEAHARWDEQDLRALFSAAGLQLADTCLRLGPGLARFAKGTLNERA